MADENDKPTGFKPKFWSKAILTHDGRHAFLQSVESNHVLHYTRVTLSSQKMVDGQGNTLDNEAISSLTGLSDDLKEGIMQLTPVVDNHFAVTADFDNKNVPDDIEFSSIGWYGRIDTVDPDDHDKVTETGKEVLIAVLPTTKEYEVLAAGAPDHRSTQVISAQLDFTISDAANVNMTVNEIGYVTRAELNSWEVDMEGKINKELEDQAKNLTVELDGKDATKPDENHVINLPTYDKTTIDKMMASAGKGAGIHSVQGVAPNSDGNVDLSGVFYAKEDVDRLVNAQKDRIDSLTGENGSKTNQIQDLNTQITGLNNQLNDLLNRVKFLEENAVMGKRFAKADEAAAEAWEKDHPTYIAFISDK
ncbi:hypothetical protein [Lactobacillus sp. HT06-2]|uniref:hypothetical protein n=1 Tax=Lactobacillus sp. HT06-2 TaxID=2080222 RepID=UPI000CD7E4A1|nr:hypothetical protein [Lactobacillus sp. HT06-2]